MEFYRLQQCDTVDKIIEKYRNYEIKNYKCYSEDSIIFVEYDMNSKPPNSNNVIINNATHVIKNTLGGAASGLMFGPTFFPITTIAGAVYGASIGILSLFPKTPPHRLYLFNQNTKSVTSEYIGMTREEAAKKVGSDGTKLFNEGKYTNAIEEYKKAYYLCPNEYHKREIYKNHCHNAEAELFALKAHNFMNAQMYSKAIDNYMEAINIANISNRKKIFELEMHSAQLKKTAVEKNIFVSINELKKFVQEKTQQISQWDYNNDKQLIIKKEVSIDSTNKMKQLLESKTLLEVQNSVQDLVVLCKEHSDCELAQEIVDIVKLQGDQIMPFYGTSFDMS